MGRSCRRTIPGVSQPLSGRMLEGELKEDIHTGESKVALAGNERKYTGNSAVYGVTQVDGMGMAGIGAWKPRE